MSKVTVRKAALLTGKSRETINSATKDGTISYTLNARKHKVIDIAELQRVYPLVRSVEEIEQSDTVNSRQNRTAFSQSAFDKDLAVLKERLESLSREKSIFNEERIRERRQLESEIENLRSSLERSQEQNNKAILLLTDQRKNEERRGLLEIKENEDRIALKQENEALRSEKKRILQHNQRLKKRLEQMQNKSFWELLFRKT